MKAITTVKNFAIDMYNYRVEGMRFMLRFGKPGVCVFALFYMLCAYLGFKVLGIWVPVMVLKALYAIAVTIDIFAYMEAKRG